jgi:hypothetical protein
MPLDPRISPAAAAAPRWARLRRGPPEVARLRREKTNHRAVAPAISSRTTVTLISPGPPNVISALTFLAPRCPLARYHQTKCIALHLFPLAMN